MVRHGVDRVDSSEYHPSSDLLRERIRDQPHHHDRGTLSAKPSRLRNRAVEFRFCKAMRRGSGKGESIACGGVPV